jgi:hypothetical protein
MISFLRSHKFEQLIADIRFQSQGLNHPGAMIVAPAEATAKGQDLKIVQTHITRNQGVDVGPPGYRPGKPKGIGGFMITVQAEPRQYQYIRF